MTRSASTGTASRQRRPISTRTVWTRWPAIRCPVGPGRRTRTGSPWGQPRRSAGAQAVLVDGDQLAGLDLADERRADDVEGRGLRRHHPATLEPAEDERPDALGVAGGVQRASSMKTKRERALELRQQRQRRAPRATVGVGASSAVTRSVSLVLAGGIRAGGRGAAASAGRSTIWASSRVLVRLPLWPSAIEPARSSGTSAGRCARCWRRWSSSGRGRPRCGP